MFRRPINQSVRWSMKKALNAERLTKFRGGPTSKLEPTKIVIKNKIKISSTCSHLTENAKGSWLGSKLGKITPYQWVTDFTKKESLEIRLPRSAFVTKRYNNNCNSDTFENDEFLNRANLEKVLCSQLSNVKGVHELYNFEGRKNVKDFILILGSKGPTRNVLLTDDMKEKIKEIIKSPKTKRIATSVISGFIHYTVGPGIGTVIKFVLTNGDVVETSIGEDSVALVCIGFCLRSWREQFHAKGTNNSSMNDIFKRGMKQFAKGVAYRLVADAVKDGGKKLHERYNSTKSKNEKDNGGSELKKEDISHHDGDGPNMINNEDESKDDTIDEESIIIFIPFETTDDDDLFIKATEEFAKGIAY